jgi:hypothetical protein
MDCSKYLLVGTYKPGGTMLGMKSALGFKYKVTFLSEKIIISDNGIIPSPY